MATVRQTVSLNFKEVSDCLIDKAKVVPNGKENGPQIQGSIKIEFVGEGAELSALIHFERAGGK